MIKSMKIIQLFILVTFPINVFSSSKMEAIKENLYIKNTDTFIAGNTEFSCKESLVSCKEQKKLYIKSIIEYKNDFPEAKIHNLNLSKFNALQKLKLIRELNLDDLIDVYEIKTSEAVNKYYCREKKYFNEHDFYLDVDCKIMPNTQLVTDWRTYKDLIFGKTNYKKYNKGRYSKGIKLFMFCRENRSFPCLMLLKDKEENQKT